MDLSELNTFGGFIGDVCTYVPTIMPLVLLGLIAEAMLLACVLAFVFKGRR